MRSDPNDEALPFNLQAETGILGALMFDRQAYSAIEDMLQGQHFYLPGHALIFDAIVGIYKKDGEVDPVLIDRALKGQEDYEVLANDRGAIGYLTDLLRNAPPWRSTPQYAEIIVDNAVRREIIRLARYTIDEARSNREENALDVISAAQKNMDEVAAFGPTKVAWVDLGAVYLRQLHKARDRGGDEPGIPTGIHDLDKVLGGLRPSTTNVLGARPGMGKSAVAVQIALNMAKAGYGVAFFSLEMPEEQLATRFGCALAYDRMAPVYSGKSTNPTYEDFERGNLTEAQWARLEDAAGELAELPIYMDFRSKMKVSQMSGAVRRLQREWKRRGLKGGVSIVDHILHVAGSDPKVTDPTQKFTEISGSLLDMHKTLEMPGLVLCQLNRSVESRDDKRPTMSDLKFTGALEEDAYSVSFLYRPEYYNRPPVGDEESPKAAKAWEQYHADKRRWANRLLWLQEKNRGGRGQQQVEMFCDIGCNAVQNLDMMAADNGSLVFPTGGAVFGDDV
ncbi:DNA helicase [Caulobacter phage Sansa]|uniref:DNA 5'-3' helicase n=1 Tax=Caulobacter phage Sansa TaxID=1675600 RepID=A0A0K1LLU6_9CAUD|nr:DnaB-like replicative helicase [Caulobacter phage Sansa]AKU43487.1 DNA helicase [Caulobacter phage Sansa]